MTEKTIKNEEARDTEQLPGTAIYTGGKLFTVMTRTDHDAAIDLVVQGSWTKDFTEDLWEIDQFTLSASVAGADVYQYDVYDETFGYIRVIATAQAVPTEGDIDVWISTE